MATMVACAGDPDRGGVDILFDRSQVGRIGDQMTIVDSVSVEETKEALVVNPFVDWQPDGRFLVADMSEGQLRGYGRDGSRLWTRGTKGWGPGEWQLPAEVIAAGENMVVVDGRRGLVRISVRDSSEWTPLPTDLKVGFQVASLGGDSLLVAGFNERSAATNLLHVVDLNTGQVRRSFFPMPGNDYATATTLSAGVVSFALRDGNLFVTVGAIDSIFTLALSGDVVKRMPLRSKYFIPSVAPHGTMTHQRWRETFSRHHRLYALASGWLAVDHVRVVNGRRVWGTVVLDPADGRVVLDQLQDERLLGARGDTLLFGASDNPAKWYLATLSAKRSARGSE